MTFATHVTNMEPKRNAYKMSEKQRGREYFGVQVIDGIILKWMLKFKGVDCIELAEGRDLVKAVNIQVLLESDSLI
jgi:hypothetical protein